MAEQVVGLGAMVVSDDPKDVLTTYSLGSCIGVSLYDRDLHLGGLIHCMLPLSTADKANAEVQPSLFVDTGVLGMLREFARRGSKVRGIDAKIAGASSFHDSSRTFRIGAKNETAVRKILWKNGVLISGEDVGGSVPRNMTLDIANGRTTVIIARRSSAL